MSVDPTVDILVSDVIRCLRSEGRIHHRRHSLTEGPEVFLSSADVPVNWILSDLAKPDAAILHRRRQLLSTEDRSLPILICCDGITTCRSSRDVSLRWI